LKLIIHGQPQAKMRARTCRRGREAFTYDPQDAEKTALKWKIKHTYHELPNVNPLYIKLDFYLLPALSDPTRNLKLHGVEEHTNKKDIDNLEKFFLDCANKILYNDDSQIISINSSKQWSENPRTEVEIITKDSMNIDDLEKKIINLFSPTEFEELFNDAKILFILAENSRNPSFDQKEQWLKQSATSLTAFAAKYGEKLSKINKFTKKQILQEVVQEIQQVHAE